jgi:hypothetical protein
MRRGLFPRSTILAFAAALALTGCAVFKIVSPTANQSVSSPVPAEVDWGQSYQSFKVVLDPAGQNLDVTNQFTVTSVSGGYIAKATLTMSPGPHILVASGSLYTWYTQGYANTSTQQSFTVQGTPSSLTLSATPNPLSVTGTSAATLTVGVTLGGAATGPVTVNVVGLPQAATATPSSLSFPGNGSLPTSVSAPASVIANSYPFALNGTATNATGSASPTLKVLPTITSATATTAPLRRGSTINLAGTHFDSTCANDKVTIGGVPVTLIPPCSATSLKFTVPGGAPSGATSILVTVNSQAASFPVTVTPTEVVVVGGPASTTFAVIDFTDPANPIGPVSVNPGIGGTVVDCSGKIAAVGSASTGVGKIVMYDISDPANPAKLGSFTSNFTQLGAIKFDGATVLAGDGNGSQVVLVNATNPSALALISKPSTGIIGISSTGLGAPRGIVSGPNSSTMDIISGIPANPTPPVSFNPNNGIGLTTDLSGILSAVGSKNGGTVKLVNVSTPAVTGSQATTLGSVDSVSISGSMVAAGSNNNSAMFLINFATPTSPQISNPITLIAAGGWTVVLNGSPMQLVAGDLNGFDVNLLSVTTNAVGKPAATLVKSVNSGVGSIASACVTTF